MSAHGADVRDLVAQLRAMPNGRTHDSVADVTDVASSRAGEGSAILDDMETFLGRFIAYPSEHERVAHTLWNAHTHMMDLFDSTPRCSFLSPEPASGKTRGLEVTELLVPRPVEAINVTAPYLFRKVDDPEGRPTILFDEIDTVFGPKAREHEDVRGLLNAGHRKGAVAGRCVVRGKTVETVEYPAYCAVAMAGLGDLPDTILTRSVAIRMRRRSRNERVEPFRRRLAAAEGDALRSRLASWAKSVEHRLEGTDFWPEMPTGVEDRDADVWEALLIVADAAGGDWPQRARAAAIALVAQSKESTPSLGIRLLADLRTVFGDRDAMTTDAILTALQELPEAPWAELVAGKPLNARGLAKRLTGYGIKSRTIRVGDKTPRGYARKDLADAWDRYLPTVADVAFPPSGRETNPSPSTTDKTPVSLFPRESATSTTSATRDIHTPPNGRENPHDEADFATAEDEVPVADSTSPESATSGNDAASVADVADVADFRGDRGTRDHEAAIGNGHRATVIAQAKELATLTPDELTAYRQELAAAPAHDPHLATDREALSLLDAARAAGVTA